MVRTTHGGRAVLVVGAGVAGMHASLILAEAGAQVYLVDSAPTAGGLPSLLDKTFPTHSCGICQMSLRGPAYCPVIEVGRHPGIHLMVSSTVTDVSGNVGEFFVRVATRGEFIRSGPCDGCGECEKVCPVVVRVAAFSGMGDRRAIYRPSFSAVPGGFALDEAACTKCGKCVHVCPRGAIDLSAEGTSTKLQVGAVIVSAGMSVGDPRVRLEYSYDPGKNIITGLELERIMSASGPTGGRLARPSDGKAPGRVAFVQCVGSRDRSTGSAYCSSVCCTYAVKEAMSVREFVPNAAVKVFYLDVRATGKGFEEYYRRAKELGVEFENCRVAEVEERNGVVRVSGESSGVVTREEFDLVVLSTGFLPGADLRELAGTLGIEAGPYGFIQPLPQQGWRRVKTSRPGIFVCGGAVEPQDIPTAVMWAGACALQALKAVGQEADADEWSPGGGMAAETTPPPEPTRTERGVATESAGEGERIGVFVCKCDSAMAGLCLDEVAKAARAMDGVVVAQEIPRICEPPGLGNLRREVEALDVTRVVVAACSPRDILHVLERGLMAAGVPRGLVEVANIREQCAWVHSRDGAATPKARDLVAMAVEQVRLAKPLREQARPIPSGAVVIGCGPAGMQAAASLADLGHEVHLVEKDSVPGGMARRIFRALDGTDVQEVLRTLEERIRSDSHITIHTGSRVTGITRRGGGFHVCIGQSEIECGAVIVATGGTEAPVPSRFRMTDVSRLMTQTELEAHLNPGCDIPGDVESLVMVQCAGSRDDERPYCSKVCCSQALKNALRVKALRPDTEVYILHRDVRVLGFAEASYEQAREMGVVFIRYPEDVQPRIIQADLAGRQAVEVYDEALREFLRVPADLVVVSTGVEGAADPELARALGVSYDGHGFFAEANSKVAPVDFLVPGVYLCGLARAPGLVSDALVSAEAAAARVGAYLSAKQARSATNPSRVRARRCVGCGVCVGTCPYDARSIDEETKVVRVDEFLCRGCGACQVACPSGASEHLGFEAKRILSALDVAFGRSG